MEINPERERKRSSVIIRDSLCTSDSPHQCLPPFASPWFPSRCSRLSHMHDTHAFCPVCTYSSAQCSLRMPCHCSPTYHSNLSNEPAILLRHHSEISLLSFVHQWSPLCKWKQTVVQFGFPFHICSNQTEVAETALSFVMTLKELDESILSDLERYKNCREC